MQNRMNSLVYIMKNYRIFTIIAIAFFSASCHVDKEYSLKRDNINYEINAGQQIVVPIGSFSTIKIKDMLNKEAEKYFNFEDDEDYCFYQPEGKTLTNFQFGRFEIAGLEFIHLDKAHIPHIRFYMDIRNALPFTFDVTCSVIDTLGNPVKGVIPVINAHIEEGSEEIPSFTPATLDIMSSKELKGVAFDGIRFDLKVAKMPSSDLTINRSCGLAIKNVRIQLPEGLNFKIRKNKKDKSE